MSYKNDSEIVILNSYGKMSSLAKAQLFETYDRLRDLTVSGPSIGGSGMGKFGSMIMNIARTFGASPFVPSIGSEAITIPGTSYYAPITGGTGIIPGGQAAFGLAPFSQINGFPTGGAAPIQANLAALSQMGVNNSALATSLGIGSLGALGVLGLSAGIGDDSVASDDLIGAWPDDFGTGGIIAGGASPVDALASAGGLAAGTAAGAGFGRNWVMPLAGIASGIGGLLTTLGPYFGPFGIAGAAAGSILSGISGSVLHSFQHVSNRVLVNADTILSNKIKNLETTIKQLDAQQDIVKKLLKESIDGDKKALDNL